MSTPTYHPDLAATARRFPRGLGRPSTRWLFKGIFRFAGGAFGYPKERVTTDDGVTVFVARHTEGKRPTLLWLHGGGLIYGDPRQDAAYLQRVSAALDVHIVSVDYRVAPEHPFPAAFDDCVSAYAWTLAQEWVDVDRVIVGGSSAGGGLAAALCQQLARAGGPQPVMQLLVYPMLDDRSAETSTVPDAALRVWDRESNRYGWSSYLAGHDRDALPDFAVPARTADLGGLPPAWIGVGSLDLFHDEDVDYAQRLEAAGVDVELLVVPGAFHGFDAMVPDAEVSRAFIQAQIEAMRRGL